jgi:hypothetical protein
LGRAKPLRDPMESLKKAREALKDYVSEHDLRDAEKIVGILWAELLTGTLIRMGWTGSALAEPLQANDSNINRWKNADEEPDARHAPVLARFWQDQLEEVKALRRDRNRNS